MRALVVVMILGLGPTPAFADADNRPQDRFSFGLAASNATRGVAAGVGTPIEPVSGLALETSYWPNDFLGFAFDAEVLHIPASDPATAESTNTGLGAAALVAIPLRYVQPYAGVWGGVRYNFVQRDSRGVNPTWAPRAGMNIYINRNLRLFAQWESIPLESDGTEVGNVVSLGLRWSPDVFHRQRGVTKFNAVWSYLIMSVGLWVTTSVVAGR